MRKPRFDNEEMAKELNEYFLKIKEKMEVFRPFSIGIFVENDIYIEDFSDDLEDQLIEEIYKSESAKNFYISMLTLKNYTMKPIILKIIQNFNLSHFSEIFQNQEFMTQYEEETKEDPNKIPIDVFNKLIKEAANNSNNNIEYVTEEDMKRQLAFLILSIYSYTDFYTEGVIKYFTDDVKYHQLLYQSSLNWSYREILDLMDHGEKIMNYKLLQDIQIGTPSKKLSELTKRLNLNELFQNELTKHGLNSVYNHFKEIENIRHHLAHAKPIFEVNYFKTSNIYKTIQPKINKLQDKIKKTNLGEFEEKIPKLAKKLKLELKNIIPYILLIDHLFKISIFYVGLYSILIGTYKKQVQFKK